MLSEDSLAEFERRVLRDRRKQPTPIISRYTFGGRRKLFRRKEDQQKGGYVDHYNAGLLFLLILLVALNALDTLFTMMILDHGGKELNPLVRSAIEIYGDQFWIWKFTLVSVNTILLCLNSMFGYVQKIIMGICLIYVAIVAYEIVLLDFL